MKNGSGTKTTDLTENIFKKMEAKGLNSNQGVKNWVYISHLRFLLMKVISYLRQKLQEGIVKKGVCKDSIFSNVMVNFTY